MATKEKKAKPKASPRITMTKDRRQAIYRAVYDVLIELRVNLARGLLKDHPSGSAIDSMIAQALDQAGTAAIEAAANPQAQL